MYFVLFSSPITFCQALSVLMDVLLEVKSPMKAMMMFRYIL